MRGLETHFLTTFHNEGESIRKNFGSCEKEDRREDGVEITGWESIEAF